MEEDCQRALESFFPHGCGCCGFKHNTCGIHLEVPDYTPDSSNVLSPKCFTSLRCPHVLKSSEDAVAGERCREVAEESGRGAPLGD